MYIAHLSGRIAHLSYRHATEHHNACHLSYVEIDTDPVQWISVLTHIAQQQICRETAAGPEYQKNSHQPTPSDTLGCKSSAACSPKTMPQLLNHSSITPHHKYK